MALQAENDDGDAVGGGLQAATRRAGSEQDDYFLDDDEEEDAYGASDEAEDDEGGLLDRPALLEEGHGRRARRVTLGAADVRGCLPGGAVGRAVRIFLLLAAGALVLSGAYFSGYVIGQAAPHPRAVDFAPSQEPVPATPPAPGLVVLVSLDGFRADYLDRALQTAALNDMARRGCRAEYMQPVYPSKTMPNHMSMVTGKLPQDHGIVDNRFVDLTADADAPCRVFDLLESGSGSAPPCRMQPKWYLAEPLWVTAERRGIRTASMMWPGADVPFNATRPTHVREFDGRVTADQRVAEALAWLDLAESHRPELLFLYIDDADSVGHVVGPDGDEASKLALDSAIARADAAVGRLLAGLAARRLQADVLVVSDHGMARLQPDNGVSLEAMGVPVHDIEPIYAGDHASFRPLHNATLTVADMLRAAGEFGSQRPDVRCFAGDALPPQWKLHSPARVAPVWCAVDVGGQVLVRAEDQPHQGGNHGYDNSAPEMRAIFLADGPRIRAREQPLAPVSILDVYPLVAELIGLGSDGGSRALVDQVLLR